MATAIASNTSFGDSSARAACSSNRQLEDLHCAELPPSSPSPLKTFFAQAHLVLQNKLQNWQAITSEFHRLNEKDRFSSVAYDEATIPSIAAKNRYINVLPYNHNRVKLSTSPDYINASRLHGSDQKCQYIATQGPLPTTVVDFWQMIYDNDCPAIIMLTNTIERGSSKCARYAPDKKGEKLSTGKMQVRVMEVSPLGRYTLCRTLEVKCKSTGNVHQLQQFHFNAWPDHGTPKSSEDIRLICSTLNSLRGQSGPFVVHCSAGIGRTGAFCTIDTFLQNAAAWKQRPPSIGDLETLCSIEPMVQTFREQRMGMVQNLDQYIFCYKAITDGVKELADMV